MAINNKALVHNLNKPDFSPDEFHALSHSVSKKVNTAVLDEQGKPTDMCQTIIITTSVMEDHQ